MVRRFVPPPEAEAGALAALGSAGPASVPLGRRGATGGPALVLLGGLEPRLAVLGALRSDSCPSDLSGVRVSRTASADSPSDLSEVRAPRAASASAQAVSAPCPRLVDVLHATVYAVQAMYGDGRPG